MCCQSGAGLAAKHWKLTSALQSFPPLLLYTKTRMHLGELSGWEWERAVCCESALEDSERSKTPKWVSCWWLEPFISKCILFDRYVVILCMSWNELQYIKYTWYIVHPYLKAILLQTTRFYSLKKHLIEISQFFLLNREKLGNLIRKNLTHSHSFIPSS